MRFFDRDELFKHLRREHFYCHFCDADGANCYYADYAALRVHFKSDHFLCEDGECAQEQFTAVFRTEIDLRAHIASLHSSGLSRQAARQNRTLDLEITLAPRGHGGQNGGAAVSVSTGGTGGPSGNHRTSHRDTQNEFDTPSAHNQHGSHLQPQYMPQQQPQRVIDSRNENEFPTLGGGPASTGVGAFTLSPLVRAYGGTRGIARTLDNFPTLGGGSGVPAPTPSTGTAYKKSASALLKAGGSAASSTGSASSVIHLASRPATGPAAKRPDVNRAQDFPSLGSSSAGATSSAGPVKGKKSASLFLDDDFVALVPSANYSGSIAAKHRQLANNGYESALTGSADSKLGLVKQPQAEIKKAAGPLHVPKISSAQNFPTLGNAPSAAMAAQWVTLGSSSKRAPVESKKSKVAPPPLSTQPQPTASKPGKSIAAAAAPATSKKPVSADTKKPAGAAATTTRPSSTTSAAAAKGNNKSKQKNYNPFESDSDEEANKFHATVEVLSATAAKHRGMVDSYESVAKAGGTKLSLVQQRSDTTKPASPFRAAPKLGSTDNFPSLGGGTGSSTTHASALHFTSMLKSANGKKANSENNNDGSQSNRNTVTVRAPPPPGFAPPPPPGFKTRPAAVDPIAVLSTEGGPSYQYRAPNNSARRNQTLFTHVQSIGEPVVVNNFKQISQMFINGLYKTEPYYEDCRVVLGGRFEELFPEMLALLPDIGKQQVSGVTMRTMTKVNIVLFGFVYLYRNCISCIRSIRRVAAPSRRSRPAVWRCVLRASKYWYRLT